MPQREPDRDEPLLGTVVQVPLEPSPLLVARRDDPRPRGLDLVELAPQRDAQARDLDRQPGDLEDLVQQTSRSSSSKAL